MKLDPEIVALHKMGFAVHWLRRKSKIPVEKNWTSGPRYSLSELEERFRPGQNPGVRLGRVSEVGGGFLAVLDLDVKSEDPAHAEEALAWLGQHYPEAVNGPHLVSGRGNGSAHFYVRVKQPVSKNDTKARSGDIVRVKMPSVSPNADERRELTLGEIAAGIRLRPAWEVSLLCEGRQAALVGAIHPDTENRYAWGKRPKSADDFPFIEVSGDKPALDSKATEFKPVATVDFVEVDLDELGLRPNQIAAIVDGTGVKDRSAEVFALCMAMVQRKIPDNVILSVFTDPQYYLGETAFDHAKTPDRVKAANWVNRYCLGKAKSKVNESVFDTEKPAKGLVGVGEEDWQAQLEIGGSPPRIKSTFLNLRLILAKGCNSVGFIERDLFSLNDSFTVDTPWGNTRGERRAANHDDALRIKDWLAKTFNVDASQNQIEEILTITAIENGFHPLRKYLDGLVWDGVPRVATAFKTYMGAQMPEPYLSDVTRKFFQACIKRAYEPGCKFDHVPILEGLQGKGKSSFVRYMVGDEWFLDALPNMADKDAALYLQGVWVCELGELATLGKSSLEVVKGFITRTTDKFRPPYGQRRADYPRTTLFVGTTDQDQYLSDPAGNRRFWPIHVTQCDFKAVIRDRDQLWAEAVFLYLFDSEPLWLEGKALAQLVNVHGTRSIEGEKEVFEELWEHWNKDGQAPKEIRLVNLFKSGMPFFEYQVTPAYSRAAARVLKKAGYFNKHTNMGSLWVHRKTLKD